jgi:hypothetical protein
VLSGRDLTRDDIESSARVAIVNESFVKRYFGAENPLGRSIDVSIPDSDAPLLFESHFEVVGIIRDIVNDDIREPVTPEAYVPVVFLRPGGVGLVVRTAGEPLSFASAIRREVRAIDSTVALTQPLALDSEVNRAFYEQPRFVLIVLGLFAVTGLLLVAVGIYGVLAYTVSQQTRDIAIRLAVGGDTGDVLRFIVMSGLRLVALGTGIGLLSSLGTNRLLESQLWRTSPHDAMAFVFVVMTIGGVGTAACLIPALRAMRIEPMSALRQE